MNSSIHKGCGRDTIKRFPSFLSEDGLDAIAYAIDGIALALGSTKLQSIFRVTVPAAKSGIVAGMVLGVGRAIGEAMAVMMVAGNAAIMPEFLKPVRLLTASIPIEWAYSSGIHREALYGIGLVLFVFIMIINISLHSILSGNPSKPALMGSKKGGIAGDR